MTVVERDSSVAALQGTSVWLTRPRYQLAGLTADIESRGGQVLALPMFEIEALPMTASLKQRILDLDRYDLLFFVSTNAARMGMECVQDFWPQLPAHQQYFSVGPTTAEALAEFGVKAEHPDPAKGMNSEALLAIPALADIEGRRALIFRGQGGREILASGLRDKGASVDYAEVYRRAVPDYSEAHLRQCLLDSPPDIIVISSAEALANLHGFLMPLWPDLLKTDLLVSSERLRQDARGYGFEQVHLAAGATDPAIVEALTRWHQVASTGNTVL